MRTLLKRFSSSLLILLLAGVLVVSAAAPTGGYIPAQTLNPDCTPGSTDCFVKSLIPIGGSTGQVLTTDGSGVLSWNTPSTIATSVPASGVTGAADVTAGSTKVTLAGTTVGAVLKAFSVDVNEGNLSLQNIGGALSSTQLGAINIANIGGTLSTTQQNAINFSNISGTVSNTQLANSSFTTVLGTSGTDINISGSPTSLGGTLTLNIPTSSAAARGLLSAADWNMFNTKQNSITLTTNGTSGVATLDTGTATLNIPNYAGAFDGETDYAGQYFMVRNSQNYQGYNLQTSSGYTNLLGEDILISVYDPSAHNDVHNTYTNITDLVNDLNALISSIGNTTVYQASVDASGMVTLYAPAGIMNNLQLFVRNNTTGDFYNTANSGDPEGDGDGQVPYTVTVGNGYRAAKVATDIFNTTTDKVFFYRPGGGGTTLTGDYVGWSNPEGVQWSSIPAFNSSLTWRVQINSLDTDGLGNTSTGPTTSTFATFADLVDELNNQLAGYGSSFRLTSVGDDRIFVTDLSGNVLPDGDPYFTTNSFNNMEIDIMDNAGSGWLVKGTNPKTLTVSGVSTGGGTGGMYYGTLPSVSAWNLNGNSGTTPGTDFIGTTDAQDLVFKTHAVERMRILADGNVGIGTTTPANKLEIAHGIAGNSGLRFTNLTSAPLLATNATGDVIASTLGNILPGGSTASQVLTSDGAGNFSWTTPATVAANNGLTVFSSNVQLGGLAGSASAANLLSNREIPMNGNSLAFTGGGKTTTITSNGRITMNQDVNVDGWAIDNSGRLGIRSSTEIRLNTNTLSLYIPTITTASQATTWYTGASSLTFDSSGGAQTFRIYPALVEGTASPYTFSTTSGGADTSSRTGFRINATVGTIGNGSTTEIAQRVNISDSSTAVTRTLVGTYVDVSGGTNTSATRYAGLFMGGNVGIGTTTPADRLQVSGDIRVGTAGANGCLKDFSGGTITGTCSSDERLKTNITDITSVLDRISQVRVVNYNWNDTAANLYRNDTNTRQTGYLAQNIATLFPELVITNPDGYQQVNYSAMGIYAIEAIKELNLKVDTAILSSGNTASSGFFDALKSWLGNVSNGLEKLFAREIETKQLCISDETGAKTCLNKSQIDALLGGNTSSGSNTIGGISDVSTGTDTNTDTGSTSTSGGETTSDMAGGDASGSVGTTSDTTNSNATTSDTSGSVGDSSQVIPDSLPEITATE